MGKDYKIVVKRRPFDRDPYWIYREFESWLKTNRQRFNKEPYLFKKNKRGARYKFKGVNGRISLWMDTYQFIVSVAHYDIISEYDVSLEKTKSGRYFCEMCIPKPKKYYHNYPALLTAHCFEPLIKWVNANLKSGKILVIKGKPRYWSSASIMDSSDARRRKKKSVRFRYPVIKERIRKRVNI